jgi:hypothetical protein
MGGRLVSAIVGTTLLLALAAPASAKEGVVAKVRVPVSRDAASDTKVTIVWELTVVESGKARPFGANRVFLRLVGPGGSRSPRAYAVQLGRGWYRASARVPRGGIRRVVIGLMGWNDYGPAPVTFPVIGRVFR